jgi:predicted transcriptional regulator
MEVPFTSDLEAKIADTAAQQGLAPAEVVQEVVARYFDESARLVDAVKLGEEPLDRGEYLTHEEVGRRLKRFLDA